MGAINVVVDHLSRLTNESSINITAINNSFPNEFLFSMHNISWYTNIVNYLAIREMPYDWNSQYKKKFLKKVKSFYWDDPYLFKYCLDQSFWRCIFNDEVSNVI